MYVCMEICMLGNIIHLLRDYWQRSFKITEKVTRISFENPQLTLETHSVYPGYALLVYSAFLRHVLQTLLGIVKSAYFE